MYKICLTNASCEKYPLVLLLHNADQEASHFLEENNGNRDFTKIAIKEEHAANEDGFEEAEPI